MNACFLWVNFYYHKNHKKLLETYREISTFLKFRTSVIFDAGQSPAHSGFFMVVILIIIYLPSVMNPSIRKNSLIPRCCILYSPSHWHLETCQREGTGFCFFSFLYASFLLLLRWQERNFWNWCILKITNSVTISHFPDPGLKG